MSRITITTAVWAIILIVAGYFVSKFILEIPKADLKKNQDSAEQIAKQLTEKPSAEIKLSAPVSPAPTALSGYKLYKNSEFGFEIQYPENWLAVEEPMENVRGEQTKGFFFKKPDSDLRFAVLPRDGLSYGLPENGTSSQVFIGGSLGAQSKWTLSDGRRLWLIYPQYGLFNWSQDIGRIDVLSSAVDPIGDTKIFEKMLNSFKFVQ